MKKGKLIVIDGMDATGKETQSKLLFKYLKEKFGKVKLYSFPNYDEKSSYFVKEYLRKEYCRDIENPIITSAFYSLDRAITYYTEIKEKYDQGYIIILDRYALSNIFYTLDKCKLLSDKMHYCKNVYTLEFEMFNIPKPDISFVLIGEPYIIDKLLNKRYNGYKTKRDINENIQMQKTVYCNIADFYNINNNYLKKIYGINFGDIEIIKIFENNKSRLRTIEEIHKSIRHTVLEYM